MRVHEELLYEKIGDCIRSRRAELGWSQWQLAQEVGLERTSITNIEKGRQHAPLHIIYIICFALRVDPCNLLPPPSEVSIQESAPIAVDLTTTRPKTDAFVANLQKRLASKG